MALSSENFLKKEEKSLLTQNFPQHLIQAFVAAEDGSFFKHGGIHYQAIFRALLANIKAGKKVQGGSTITQQTARSLLLSSKKNLYSKTQRNYSCSSNGTPPF